MKETLRYIIGYIIGGTVFLILIPLGLHSLTKFDCLFGQKVLFNSDMLRVSIAALLFIVGAIFAAWSNLYLFTFGKGGPTEGFGVAISPQTKKLVTSGPYRYSRNPMVFGAFSIYSSIAIYFNSITVLICLLVFLCLAITYLKLSEENRLVKDFGDEYIEYRKRVSMIVPLKKMKLHEI